jgi:hypothetical protein
MLECTLVQSRGSGTSVRNANARALSFVLRLPSYRSVRTSLVDGVDITVAAHCTA